MSSPTHAGVPKREIEAGTHTGLTPEKKKISLALAVEELTDATSNVALPPIPPLSLSKAFDALGSSSQAPTGGDSKELLEAKATLAVQQGQMEQQNVLIQSILAREAQQQIVAAGLQDRVVEGDAAGSPREQTRSIFLNVDGVLTRTLIDSDLLRQAPSQSSSDLLTASTNFAEKHTKGQCRPCVYYYKNKCDRESECQFCHFPHDKPQRAGKSTRLRNKARDLRAKLIDEGVIYSC